MGRRRAPRPTSGPYSDEGNFRKLELRSAQWEVYSDPHRFRILVAGRRFGKTFLSIAEMLREAMLGENRLCYHVFPTYKQGRDVCWNEYKRFAYPYSSKIDETRMEIELANGSLISVRGADRPDALRGGGLNFVVMDEYADAKQEAWTAVLRPSLADKLGRALFVGTPKGMHNHFYDLALASEGDPDWSVHKFTTLEGGNVPDAEVVALARDLDERLYRQELEATWETLGNTVAYSFSRDNVREDLADIGGDLFAGMDFNVNPMSTVLAVKAGDELHVLDELELENSGTEEMVQSIWQRIENAGHISGNSLAKRSVTACPDPSGNSRKTAAPVGQTDFTILTKAGIRINAPRKAPAVADRVNDLNAMLCSKDGRRRLLIHPRCKKLIRALETLPYKEGTNLPDKSTGLDHIFDACSYMVSALFPINDRSPATFSTVGYFGM